MDIYPKYKSPFGYQVGDNGIDSYGVNHSGFSLRDEIEYQTARDNRESQMMQMYNQQGITENYPQYTTNFWGDSGNNYGFGSSNISQNIGNVTNRLNNGANNGQISANSDYNINTESLVGKPSSYFQNNNSTGGCSNNNTSAILNKNGMSSSINYDNYLMRRDLENSIKREQERELHQSLMSPPNNSQITPIPSGKTLTSQEAAYMYTPTHPDYRQIGSLEFNGKNLVWLQNGAPVKYYPAMSGHEGFQGVQYTSVANDGPIPEGNYLLAQETGQDYAENLWYKINRNMWPRPIRRDWTVTPAGWGHQRIPIQPLPTTNTFGRHSMYVHGGDNGFGSAGCIDLERGMPNFYDDWLKYNGDLPLKVKYPKGW